MTKIKAERLNALCSATGEEHGGTQRVRELLTVNSELNLPEIWQIQQASDGKGGIYWLKVQGSARRFLVYQVKHGLKKGQETFPCIQTAEYAVPNEAMEEPLQSQDFKGVGPLAGDPDLHVRYMMRFDKVMLSWLAQWEVKLQCVHTEAPSEPACLVYCVQGGSDWFSQVSLDEKELNEQVSGAFNLRT